MVTQDSTVSDTTLQGVSLNGRDLTAEVEQLSDARKTDLAEFLDHLATEDQEAASTDERQAVEDTAERNRQIVALTRATIEELTPAELFTMFHDMDADALFRLGSVYKMATHKPAEREEPKPWDEQHYDDYMKGIEALGMRILGDLAAGEYIHRGTLFDAWDHPLEVIKKSLLKGSLCTRVMYTPYAPGDVTSWMSEVDKLRQQYEAK